MPLTIEEAQTLLCAHVNAITETETIPLAEATGRVLAEDVTALMDQPPFPRSPLDGYAVRAADLDGAGPDSPVTLTVIGNIYAGSVFEGTVGQGQAVRLTTGAPIPEGADTVIRQEDTDRGTETVAIYVTSAPYKNYCFRGEDYHAGDILVHDHQYLHAGAIVVLASLGKGEVNVYKKPRIGLISTGDEVIEPGSTWQPGKIFDANRYYIQSRLATFGNPAFLSVHAADEPEAAAELVRQACKSCDFVITTGGVSVGEKDIMHDVLRILGAEQLFWRVRIKPGSPTLAFLCEGKVVLCLSGNPYGAIANFELLARPVLRKLSGDPTWQIKRRKCALQNDYHKPAGANRFLRGFADGHKVTLSEGNQSSGAISAMKDSNCLVQISPDMPGASRGDEVWCYFF